MRGTREQLAAALALLLAGCAAAGATGEAGKAAQPMPTTRQAMAATMGHGYLAPGTSPDSLVINPPPPEPGSAAEKRDEEAARAALALQSGPRFRLARVDADIFTPGGESVFSCAAGFSISPSSTPKTFALLRKSLGDLAMSTSATKDHYQRPRPFMVNNQPTCTPEQEKMLRANGSYPSGHSAIGYGWGLILAELVPDRAAQLVARGRVFGDSRRVCNVHWLSDVEEGRPVADAVVARLHADAAFRADLEAARAELRAVRAKAPAPDCALEQAALGG